MSKTNKEEPIRIAQIMGKWLGGGVESVVMNYFRNIDREKIQFDFICDEDSTDIPYQEIESLGGRVIICPPYQKLPKYIKELKKIFKDNNYKIVHSNINALSVFPLYAAKKAGVPVRIAHSHSTSNKKEWKKTLVKNLLRPFSKVYATDYFACTEHAGRWLFGDKAFNQSKVTVINNGIDISEYEYNEKIRKEMRKELGYKDADLVIGHVGRFMKQKNHEFIIDIFDALHKENDNYKLMLVGQGPLMDEIKDKVNSLGLTDSVKFLGQRSDANKLYQAMDLFLFPSLYEGLGMVLIEAQASGLPCVASTEVPDIANVTSNLVFLDLDDSIFNWVKVISGMVTQNDRIIVNDKIDLYNIEKEKSKLERYYENKQMYIKEDVANERNKTTIKKD